MANYESLVSFIFMLWKIHQITVLVLALIGGPLSLHGQCQFNHTLFAAYTDEGQSPLWVADHMYSGEYLALTLKAGQCYRVVVLDTAARAMHLQLYDALGDEPLAFTATPGGEAMILTYRPDQSQTVLLTLNLSDCRRSWVPVQVLVERNDLSGPCQPPEDRFWGAPTRVARYLFSNLR
jgi:hypothetical protein